MDFGKRFAVGAMKSVIQNVNSKGNTSYKTDAKTKGLKHDLIKQVLLHGAGNVKNQ